MLTFRPGSRFVRSAMLLALAAVLLVVTVPVQGQVTQDPDFLALMEQIAEDIEEIHQDMHKVAFGVRLAGYSLVAVAGLIGLSVVAQFLALKKRG